MEDWRARQTALKAGNNLRSDRKELRCRQAKLVQIKRRKRAEAKLRLV